MNKAKSKSPMLTVHAPPSTATQPTTTAKFQHFAKALFAVPKADIDEMENKETAPKKKRVTRSAKA